MESPQVNYLLGISLSQLKEALNKKYKIYQPLFSSIVQAKEEEKTWNFAPLISNIQLSLSDPKTYFIYNPVGTIPSNMADLLDISQTTTMEILLNSWLIYILERNLLKNNIIYPDVNFKHFLPDHIRYADISLNFLPNLLQDVFTLGGESSKKIFNLAIETRQKLNNLA